MVTHSTKLIGWLIKTGLAYAMSKAVMTIIGFPLTVNPLNAPADLVIVDAVSFGGCFILANLFLRYLASSQEPKQKRAP